MSYDEESERGVYVKELRRETGIKQELLIF
jgi:hypothetical protein